MARYPSCAIKVAENVIILQRKEFVKIQEAATMHTWNRKEIRKILLMMPDPVLFVMSACHLEEIDETGCDSI